MDCESYDKPTRLWQTNTKEGPRSRIPGAAKANDLPILKGLVQHQPARYWLQNDGRGAHAPMVW